MRGRLLSGALLALWVSAVSLAADFVAPPAPTRWVTDTAGFLSQSTRRTLDTRLEQYEQATGHQVIVWIGSDTGGLPLEDWTARAFKAWGIGRKGKDDGAVLFLFASERKLRIEVGYGLEGDLPDATANRIIQEEMVPALKAGQKDGAITAGVTGILTVLGGETALGGATVGGQPAAQRVPLSRGQMVLYSILALGLLLLLITHPRLALWLLFSLMSGGRSGGGGSGSGSSGGFGGGGGRSGGGGASGSW